MKPSPPPPLSKSASSAAVTFCIVAGSSVLFCSKSVLAKFAFAQGVDALTILALRMAVALPFFLIMALSGRNSPRPSARDGLALAGLGFLGYYVSALVNFTGLQYVSVALERIILYTYPSLVLALSAIVLKRPVRPVVGLACLLAWSGIVVAFTGEMPASSASSSVFFGAALIFVSALTYATFITLSGPVIQRMGSVRFTGTVAGLASVYLLIHYLLTHRVEALLTLPPSVYGVGVLLGIFGTVAPALLFSIGLQRAGAQNFAVISTIGPVATVFLAWMILDEKTNLAQGIGFCLTLAGGLAVTIMAGKRA